MVKESYFQFVGGLDQTTPYLESKPGRVALSLNWVPHSTGLGYEETAGYERFDGRPAPSSGVDQASIDALRAAIGPVPGSGPVRGVWRFGGVVYAFRDNAGATACVMHKESAAGWVAVAGVPVLTEGGSYEFVNYNFYADPAKAAMYGCDGVNKAFEFDGTTFTQITTGAVVDAPTHLAAHQHHLFVAQSGSVMHSNLGDPITAFTALEGAGELGLGVGVTNVVPVNDEVLGIYGEDSVYLLYGKSASSLQLKRHSHKSGAKAGTVQPLEGHVFLDQKMIRTLRGTDSFENYKVRSRSVNVQDWLTGLASLANGSLIAREQNHYRLMFAGATTTDVLVGSFASKDMAFMPVRYPVALNCYCSETEGGDEWLLAGGNDGYVYRLDSGSSFDGAAIKTLMRLPFNHERSPGVRKRWRELQLESNQVAGRALKFNHEVEFGDSDYPLQVVQDFDSPESGGIWGLSNWGEFVWGGSRQQVPPIKLTGTGVNMAMLINTTRTDMQSAWRLRGARVRYESRRRS